MVASNDSTVLYVVQNSNEVYKSQLSAGDIFTYEFLFSVNLTSDTSTNAYITDLMIVNFEYGIMLLSNDTLILFYYPTGTSTQADTVFSQSVTLSNY